MSHRDRRPSPSGPPPINEAERRKADLQLGVLRIPVKSWKAYDTDGNVVASGSAGEFGTGDWDAADEIAARRTAETN